MQQQINAVDDCRSSVETDAQVRDLQDGIRCQTAGSVSQVGGLGELILHSV